MADDDSKKHSSSRREPTQMLEATRVKMSQERRTPSREKQDTVPPPPAQEAPAPPPSVHDVHTKPTLPINLSREALYDSFKSNSNPFERSAHSFVAEARAKHVETAALSRTSIMLEDASPLLFHGESLETAEHFIVTPHMASPLISWVQDGDLHVRDERATHHQIKLSNKRLSAVFHDERITWFGTEEGTLFRFDRGAAQLSLAVDLGRRDPIVVIARSHHDQRIVLVSRDGMLYASTPSAPYTFERQGSSLPGTILCGVLDATQDELLLATPTYKILRVPLHGQEPSGDAQRLAAPATQLFFAAEERQLHALHAKQRRLDSYRWSEAPQRLLSAELPHGYRGVYLDEEQRPCLLFSRGSILLHTPLI